MRRKNQNNPGRIRQKLSELLAKHGIECSPYDLWTQEGAYRSWKWDLARWGAHNCRWLDQTKTQSSFSIYSWDTMTNCIKKGISFDPDQHKGPDIEISRAG